MQPEQEARLLAAMPATVEDLAEDFGYSSVWIWKGIKDMRARKKCFVLRWVRTGGRYKAVFMAGGLNDRPRPPLKDPTISRKIRAKRKKGRAAGPFAQLFI